MKPAADKTYLVLGNGVAGLNAAAAIRERDASGRIVLLGDEGCLTYSRPMLTKTPLGAYDGSVQPLFGNAWYAERAIEVYSDLKVLSLDTRNKKVFCGDRAFSYDTCVYALGASGFVPSIPGREKNEVVALRSIRDLNKIKRLCVDAKYAAVIGGGVIGLEAALELARLGLRVTVLEALDFLMLRLLDAETAEKLRTLLPSIDIRTHVRVKEIGGADRVTRVELADGTRIPADFIVMSCGVEANTAIAKEAGLAVERAVVVDDAMRTSAPDVYACGDCAQSRGVNLALWAEAAAQGTVAGANAAGAKLRYGSAGGSLVLNSPELSLFVAGDLGKDSEKKYETSVAETRAGHNFFVNERFSISYKKTFFADGRMTGVALLGNLSEMKALKAQLHTEQEIRDES